VKSAVRRFEDWSAHPFRKKQTREVEQQRRGAIAEISFSLGCVGSPSVVHELEDQ